MRETLVRMCGCGHRNPWPAMLCGACGADLAGVEPLRLQEGQEGFEGAYRERWTVCPDGGPAPRVDAATQEAELDAEMLLGDARYYAGEGNYEDAAIIWRVLARSGNAEAKYRLGTYLANEGERGEADPDAVAWLTEAAVAGNAAAQTALGYIRYSPPLWRGGDKRAARRLWLMAREQGDALAAHNLGVLYLLGEGVTVDRAKAMRFFGEARDGGLGGLRKDTVYRRVGRDADAQELRGHEASLYDDEVF